MELVTSVLSLIGVAIVGFIGHIVAHDFCERTSTLARWLISFATKRLPPAKREHYMEEWTAHLDECEGVLAKLLHAIGCVWGAPSIRRQMYKDVGLRMSFNLPGIGQASVRTNVYEVSVLMWFSRFTRTKATNFAYKATNFAYLGTLVLLFLVRAFVDAHERSGVTSDQFFNAIFTKTKPDDWVPTAINLTMPGESIELIGSLQASCNSPLILKVEDYFFRNWPG
jgi:hypothetical protein